jgi:hypothetical protein
VVLTIIHQVRNTQLVKGNGQAHVSSWTFVAQLINHHLIESPLALQRLSWLVHFCGNATAVVVDLRDNSVKLDRADQLAAAWILLNKPLQRVTNSLADFTKCFALLRDLVRRVFTASKITDLK